MEKIIIADSAPQIDQSVFDLFAGAMPETCFLALVSTAGGAARLPDNWKIKKSYFGPEMSNIFTGMFFILLLPALWTLYIFLLLAWRREGGVAEIICVTAREKLILTPLGRLLKIKVFWLNLPGLGRRRFKRLWRFFSGLAELLVLTTPDAETAISDGIKPERVHNISLGVNQQALERQDDLFSSLAKADKPYSFYKNFTVGSFCGNNDRRRLEILLQAVKNCINLIPNFRLVIIGPGTAGGNLNWLVKKLGLERRVWLLSEPKNILQWFDDLDLYMILAENPELDDLEKALLAASRGAPLTGFSAKNLLEIVVENQNGSLIEVVSAEALAQKIIAIEADERLRRIMSENGRQMVRDKFDRQKQLEKLRRIIG